MPEKKTTSIKVDPEKWKAVKIYCLERDIEVSDFLNTLIDKALKKKDKSI